MTTVGSHIDLNPVLSADVLSGEHGTRQSSICGGRPVGQLAAQLERISVEATSPDGRIRAGLGGRLHLALEFRDRSYGSYADSELGHQLGRVAALVRVRYRREYSEVEAAFSGGYEPDRDPVDRSFEQEAAELIVAVTSPDGWIGVTSRALESWTVVVRPGAQHALTQGRFVTEALTAAAGTVDAYRSGRARLLDKYYALGAGLPAWRRAATIDNATRESR
jgi:hypothetical protein